MTLYQAKIKRDFFFQVIKKRQIILQFLFLEVQFGLGSFSPRHFTLPRGKILFSR